MNLKGIVSNTFHIQNGIASTTTTKVKPEEIGIVLQLFQDLFDIDLNVFLLCVLLLILHQFMFVFKIIDGLGMDS